MKKVASLEVNHLGQLHRSEILFWGNFVSGIQSGTVRQSETMENRKVWKMEEAISLSEVDDLPETEIRVK